MRSSVPGRSREQMAANYERSLILKIDAPIMRSRLCEVGCYPPRLDAPESDELRGVGR